MREAMTQGSGEEMAHIASSQIPFALSQSYDYLNAKTVWGNAIYPKVQVIEEDRFW